MITDGGDDEHDEEGVGDGDDGRRQRREDALEGLKTAEDADGLAAGRGGGE
jgi:hypothetical protein